MQPAARRVPELMAMRYRTPMLRCGETSDTDTPNPRSLLPAAPPSPTPFDPPLPHTVSNPGTQRHLGPRRDGPYPEPRVWIRCVYNTRRSHRRPGPAPQHGAAGPPRVQGEQGFCEDYEFQWLLSDGRGGVGNIMSLRGWPAWQPWTQVGGRGCRRLHPSLIAGWGLSRTAHTQLLPPTSLQYNTLPRCGCSPARASTACSWAAFPTP